jgi:hypothetical protein
MPPLRLEEIEERLYGEGHRMNLLRVASRDPRLTPVDSRQVFFGHVMGLYDYASSFMARGVPREAAYVQLEAAKVMMGLPQSEVSFERAALLGDLGLRSPDVVFTQSALRLLARFHAVPPDAQLARLWRHYREVVEDHDFPAGNWCTWVRQALANAGCDVELVYNNGWTQMLGADGLPDSAETTACANEAIRRAVRTWQDRAWRDVVATRRELNPLYASLHKRVEFSEYLREGTHRSRRAIMRLRSEMIPAAIVSGRRLGVPRADRLCQHCLLGGCEDTVHLLACCPVYAQQRQVMVDAVRRCMPADVVLWAGGLDEHPERWVTLWLDGEIDGGVPAAEAYGRDRRAVRLFGEYVWRREEYVEVLRCRAALRHAVRAPLTSIMVHRTAVEGLPGI